MKNKAHEINDYGTHIFNINKLIPEGLDIEVIINKIKAGTRDFKNDRIDFDHFKIESKERFLTNVKDFSFDIPYSSLEFGQSFDGKWYVLYEKVCIARVNTKEDAINLAKTIIFLETYHKKNKIPFTLSEYRNEK
jgi:hypothetical protein